MRKSLSPPTLKELTVLNRIIAVLALILTFPIPAQETQTPNGVQDDRDNPYAFTHATLFQDHDTRLEDATLLIRDGLVVSAKSAGNVPKGYVEINVEGRYIYPGLIDMHTSYGLPKPVKRAVARFTGPEALFSTNKSAYNSNESIKSHYSAAQVFKVDDKSAGKLRKLGFTAVLTLRPDGIARGTSALVTLGNESVNEVVLTRQAAAHYSFNKGSSRQHYPTSRMGAVALLRQTHLDADWYGAQQPRPFSDLSLEAWLGSRELPQIFASTDWKTALLADEVGDEFGVQYIIEGSGDEYQRLELLQETSAAFVVPVSFPKARDVENPVDAQRVTLREMKHWELAPYNLARLAEADISFAITSNGSRDRFWSNLKKAVRNGLGKSDALAALTSVPAELLGKSDQIGSLRPGRLANFIITSGDLFEKKTKINESWIQGERFEISAFASDHSGVYSLTVGDKQYKLEIAGEPGKPKARIVNADEGESEQTKKAKRPATKISITRDLVSLSFTPQGEKQAIRLSGWPIDDGWTGNGRLANGDPVDWRLTYLEALTAEAKDPEKEQQDEPSDPGSIIYPFVAYGRQEMPQPVDLLIKNATVWTGEEAGILEHADVLIRNGRIAGIGRDLKDRRAIEVDGSGQHITAGIIDEHSHMALSGVNDVAVNSSMVRMADVMNSEDVAIYRGLAGGVTAAQLLHGSANPIGGQSALIKLRWGAPPRQLLIEGADKFIKFALGENVKRSRNPASIRYPQTRMGVEQVYMDAFAEARKYQQGLRDYDDLSRSAKRRTTEPRRDLAHDAMLEVLEGERFVTSHSYVQSEINMLMKVAESFGFRINTFTHILEGYKVADKMAQHGVGAATFSDWWAYKWEVRYAIPYNAALMQQAGVVTAINSDDREMSRRLNQEAAKAIKYGGMSEQEALSLVTINPAKLLHLDDRMGSIKVGKDADIVLWSDHPLSVYSRVNKTLVDGIVYFDAEEDVRARQNIKAERARVIQKMRLVSAKEKRAGSKPQTGTPPSSNELTQGGEL
jgi:imidazolonepropionase-like amidohydrolase|tara:strand:+ start:3346 stop:6411 length:3066 start_codon:yes stop_codon:yes gene_type:complete